MKLNAARLAARQLTTPEALQQLKVPVGWTSNALKDLDSFERWAEKIVGLLFTGIAVSLGAPFWFDMLNKVMNIRASGKAPEEKPKTPQVVPQPKAPGQQPGS